MRPVAVLGAGVGLPSLRMAAAEVGAAWGTGAPSGTVALCDADEDTLTLAWRAATDALGEAGVGPDQVSGLWWGTARPPFAEGPSHGFLAAALGMRPGGEGALYAGSTHAGMEAVAGAWDALAAGHADVALVVASDALVPGIGTAGETTTGAAAVALVLGAGERVRGSDGADGASPNGSAPPARLVARATRSAPLVDRYRGDGEAATGDVYDARLFREEMFVPLMVEAGLALAQHVSADSWAVADPDGRLGAAVAKRLGGPSAGADVHRQVGDTGSAGALLALVRAAAEDRAGPHTVGAIGYGGGRATAVAVELTRAVPGAGSVVDRLGRGRPVGYTEALRVRGQLVPMADPIPMGVPPTGAAFVRGNAEMLGLEGAKCRACGVISTPPSIHPHCVGCGGSELDVVPLARRGTVQTFVVNQTMPPPFQAPLPLVVVDLDDGARIMVQGTPADAAALGVGDVVTLTLRRYALERGVPVYGYKALRAGRTGEAGTGAPESGGTVGASKEGAS